MSLARILNDDPPPNNPNTLRSNPNLSAVSSSSSIASRQDGTAGRNGSTTGHDAAPSNTLNNLTPSSPQVIPLAMLNMRCNSDPEV